MKLCRDCKVEKKLDLFYKDVTKGASTYCKLCTDIRNSNYNSNHKEEIREYKKNYYQNNKDYYRTISREWKRDNRHRTTEYERKRKFGVTVEKFNEMLISQQGKCEICKKEFTNTPCVDHCHTTGHVRGLLCKQCNSFLGRINDSAEALERAILYLRRKS